MSDTKNTFHEFSIVCGQGGGQPGVFLLELTKNGTLPIKLADFTPFGSALSVYALSLSPKCRYLIAGTRNHIDSRTGGVLKPGVILCWAFEDLLARPGLHYASPPGPIRSLSGFTSAAIKDDGAFLVGRGDGSIALYSMGSGDSHAEIKACASGEVYAVAALGQDKWASLGADGVLRLWGDAGGELRNVWESDAFPTPEKYGALQNLYWSQDQQRLYWGSGDGQVLALDLSHDPPIIHSQQRHHKTVLAAIFHPETQQIVSAGLDDGRLICGKDTDQDEHPHEIDTQSPVVWLWPLTARQVAVACLDGRLQVREINEGSQPLPIAKLPLRSWVGYPAEQAVANRKASATGLMRQILQQADRSIEEHNWHETEAAIDRLMSQGHGIEALMLKGRLYHARQQLLLEYQIWLDIAGLMEDSSLQPVAHYGLGDVLMALQEPVAAAQEFGQAASFQDAFHRLEEARQHPLFGHDDVIHAEISHPDQFIEELEKCDILNREFRSLVVLLGRAANERLYSEQVRAESLVPGLQEELSRNHIPCVFEPETRKLYCGPQQSLRSVTWIRIRPAPGSGAFEYFQYALGLTAGMGSTTLAHYVLFDAGQVESNAPHNHAVADAWNECRHDKRCADWEVKVRTAVERAVKLTGDDADEVFN